MREAPSAGVTDFAFSQLGLDDVFQKIVEESHLEQM